MAPYRTTDYRYPAEQLVLLGTILLVLGVIAVTATATICLSALFVAIVVGIGYINNRTHHQQLMRKAYRVDPASAPEVDRLVRECQTCLQPGPLAAYVAPNPHLNAYTFGLTDPRVVVLYSALFKELDADELRFVIGHELGHISLGHTWLNSLIGGMSGIPAPFGAAILLSGAFLWWNRMCEYSADRAGLLACAKPAKAISALIKLEAGPGGVRSPQDLERVLRAIDAQDDRIENVAAELLMTHPMVIRRINQIRQYARSAAYQRLQIL